MEGFTTEITKSTERGELVGFEGSGLVGGLFANMKIDTSCNCATMLL